MSERPARSVPRTGVPRSNSPRPATAADADAMAAVLAEAFFDDPVWGPAFPDLTQRREQMRAYWRFMVGEALRFPDSLVVADGETGIAALAVWFPPGAAEIRDASVAAYDALVDELLGENAAAALAESSGRFAEARPSAPHAYLTLLAVADDARGRGAGMALLAAALRRFDDAGIPTYLESSNPLNDRKYEALGYQPRGVVRLTGGQVVQTYWREPA